MKTFLNQWSTRAIWMYAHRSKPVCRSATVVVVEDMTKPFKRRNRDDAARCRQVRAGNNHRRHVGRCRAGRVCVDAIADVQHLRRRQMPGRARGSKAARIWFERADFRIAAAEDE